MSCLRYKNIIRYLWPLFPLSLYTLITLSLLFSCSKNDPILEGHRVPIFQVAEVETVGIRERDLGDPIIPQDCSQYRIDSNNQVWRGETRIFAGLPTESEIQVDKQVACRGDYIYAGLSTGELVKVNRRTRDLAWIADIFQANHPTTNILFVDIVATPVVHGGYVYAGGLGNAFCKIRDRDGRIMWCRPISVRDILKSTRNYNVVLADDGTKYIVANSDGRIYIMQDEARKSLWKRVGF